jgi:acylphosphatase
MERRLTAHVEGRVQGVGYRAFTRAEARRLGLRGEVRNLPDGAVAVVAEGEEDALCRLLSALRRGPSGFGVAEVRAEWSAATGEHAGFRVRY